LRSLVKERLGDLVSFTTEELSKLSDAVFEIADKPLKDKLDAINVDKKLKDRFHKMVHYRTGDSFKDPALKPITNVIPDYTDFFLRSMVDNAVSVIIAEEKERIKDICDKTIETFGASGRTRVFSSHLLP
tara:strand:- start:538 stop:927 length:390 start_codon:yes stop_codon:yes gene_type:complete